MKLLIIFLLVACNQNFITCSEDGISTKNGLTNNVESSEIGVGAKIHSTREPDVLHISQLLEEAMDEDYQDVLKELDAEDLAFLRKIAIEYNAETTDVANGIKAKFKKVVTKVKNYIKNKFKNGGGSGGDSGSHYRHRPIPRNSKSSGIVDWNAIWIAVGVVSTIVVLVVFYKSYRYYSTSSQRKNKNFIN